MKFDRASWPVRTEIVVCLRGESANKYKKVYEVKV